MYDKIRDEIKRPYYIQNFPNDGQRFVSWYLRNIHLKDMNETKDCITDGADDKQIDAIVIDDEKTTIFVIQGKFIGSENVDAEPLREVLSSWIQLKDLVRLQEVGNTKLKRRLSEVATALDDDYDVSFELITTSSLTDSAKRIWPPSKSNWLTRKTSHLQFISLIRTSYDGAMIWLWRKTIRA